MLFRLLFLYKKGAALFKRNSLIVKWALQGLNLRPPDYESGATNQLSYGPEAKFAFEATKLHLCTANTKSYLKNGFKS